MSVIRDVMPAFDLVQPRSVNDAQHLLQQYGADAWIMAGGLDSFDWLKDRVKRPKVVVDLSGIEELRGIRQAGDGVEIGALTTLTEIVEAPRNQRKIWSPGRSRRVDRVTTNSQSGNHRRQSIAGYPLLVLPLRVDVLSRRRQHLLRRHA